MQKPATEFNHSISDDDDEHDILDRSNGLNSGGSGKSALVIPCKEDDVLLGRGRVGWMGNQRFQREVRRNAQGYANANSRYEKACIVFEIIATVKGWGGRFLYKPKASPRTLKASARSPLAKKGPQHNLAIANLCKVRKKVGQALRYQMELVKYQPSNSTNLSPTFPKDKEPMNPSGGGGENDPQHKCPRHEAPDNENMDDGQEQGSEISTTSNPLDGGECKTRLNSKGYPSSVAPYIVEDDGEASSQMTTSDDCNNSVRSLDLSAAAAAAMELSEDCDDHGRDSLLSNSEILSSLGYEFDALIAEASISNRHTCCSNSEQPLMFAGFVDRNDSLSPIPFREGGCGSHPLPTTAILDAPITHNGPKGAAAGDHKNENTSKSTNNGELHSWDASFSALMLEMEKIPQKEDKADLGMLGGGSSPAEKVDQQLRQQPQMPSASPPRLLLSDEDILSVDEFIDMAIMFLE